MGGRRQVEHRTLPPTTRQWTERERAIVELHRHFLTSVWQLRDYVIYTRYKKHLAPEYRREVDRLVNLLMTYRAKEYCALHETILATIWDKEDWFAVLEDPRLGRNFDDPEQRLAWEARLTRVRNLARS